jgi:hypothetical protein
MKIMRNISAEPIFFKNYLDSKPFSENFKLTGLSSTILSKSSPIFNINKGSHISVNKMSKKISLNKTYWMVEGRPGIVMAIMELIVKDEMSSS